ncbi:MAG: two-component regulator propeller domain-containing protein [Flavobacteriales bacterium]|jgi:ligand-binding sensor domain-containing protein/anti-sigma regulatory factor (Ser/Thr protein kinase)
MRNLVLVIFLIASECANFSARAQQYSFLRYSVQEGLSQSQVRCLFEDSRGYLWIGTLGGLSRFDGTRFTNYGRSDGLGNNQVSAIAELPGGRIAAGSAGSISIISALGVMTYPLPEGLADVSVNALAVEGSVLWIGTERGLFRWDNGAVRQAALQGLPDDEHIKALVRTARGDRAWIVARSAVYTWEPTRAELRYRPVDDEVTFFDAVVSEKSELLIAARKYALVRLAADGSVETFAENPQLPATTLTGISHGAKGHYWLTSRFGFLSFDGDEFTAFTDSEGLPTSDIRDALVDHEGNLWLASYGSGLLRMTGTAIAGFTRRQGLPSNAVMSIARDAAGTLWLSTYDQGVARMEEDTIIPFRSGGLESDSRVWTSLARNDGSVWFGTSDGLYTRSSSGNVESLPADELPDRMVLCLHETPEGTMWLGTASGPAMLVGRKVIRLDSVPGFPASRVRGIATDRAGQMWMATRDGVFRYSGSRFSRFDEDQGLPDRSAYCVMADAANRIWVGTQAGLALFEGNTFRTLSMPKESGSSTINFIRAVDAELWIGTLFGIYTCRLDDAARGNPRWIHIGSEEGLSTPETNLNASYADASGEVWVGTPEGLYRINRKLLTTQLSTPRPRLALASVLVNLQPPDWTRWRLVPDEATGLPADPEMAHQFNHFTFYCDAIALKYPERVEYQYWLEGLEDDWEPPTTARFASFSNLPYRWFTFHARARLQGGEWSEPVTYTFSIRPPFWLTWWFMAFTAAAIGALAWRFVRIRQRVIRDRRDKEFSEMKSRMLALEQQSLNSSMNRHFIFNALNSIQYYINRQDRLAANRYLSDFARLIRKNLDSSQTELTTLSDEIERLELYLKLEHMRFRDKFSYHVEVEPGLDQEQVRIPAMLLQPFLENSIWHGLLPKESQGEISVRIRKDGDFVEILITDNGIGIDSSLMNKSGTDSHISKGMEITENRLELIRRMTGRSIELRGPSQINDDEGRPQGTQVCIRIPLDFSELLENSRG